MKRTITTLAIIGDNDNILLGMKKRGFGEGWWNGFGGKVQDNESIEQTMLRELQEESGLMAEQYKKRAMLEFYFKGTDKEVEMHVFEVSRWTGELKETEEMISR